MVELQEIVMSNILKNKLNLSFFQKKTADLSPFLPIPPLEDKSHEDGTSKDNSQGWIMIKLYFASSEGTGRTFLSSQSPITKLDEVHIVYTREES